MRVWQGILIVPFLAASASAQLPINVDRFNPNFCNAYWQGSPNADARPFGLAVDTIVLHHTACDAVTATRHFQNFDSNVSAHFTVDKDGSVIEHVRPWDRAWHAGISLDAHGREHVNDFSIGIEIVNRGDGTDPYPDVQVQMVKLLVESIRQQFPIKEIVSHKSVAVPAGRKSDPRNYPWQSLEGMGLELRP